MSSNQQKRIEKYLKNEVLKQIYNHFFLNKYEPLTENNIRNTINSFTDNLNIIKILKPNIDIIKHYVFSIENNDYLIEDFNISRIKNYSTNELISFLSNYHNSFVKTDNLLKNIFINKEKYNDKLILYVLAKIISDKYYKEHKKKPFSAVKKNTPLRNILESPSMITFLQNEENKHLPKYSVLEMFSQKYPNTASEIQQRASSLKTQKTPDIQRRASPTASPASAHANLARAQEDLKKANANLASSLNALERALAIPASPASPNAPRRSPASPNAPRTTSASARANVARILNDIERALTNTT